MSEPITEHFDLDLFSRNWLLYAIALLQGLALLAVYKSLEFERWPYGSPTAIFGILSVLIPVPIVALLTIDRGNWLRATKMIVPTAIVVAGLGIYVGGQAEPFQRVSGGSITFIYVVTLFITLFKATMYIQQRASAEVSSYAVLFKYSWRNLVSISLAAAFTGLFYSLLMLWAALFKVLEIDFFHDLFTNEYFVIPVLVLAFGVAVTIVRDMESLLDSSSRIPQGLIKFLLPMVILISLTFLITIPFRGLELLWETGVGTALVLWLTAITLFFVNTVYRDEPNIRPYPVTLHRFIYIGVFLLPVYGAIAWYGLSLRVDQYGWTVERCWAMVVWGFLALFSVGYSFAIAINRDHWIGMLSKINVGMGLLLMATLVLANTPLLDFRKISLNSQLARLESGATELAEFDFRYVRNHLGLAGYEAMMALKEEVQETKSEIAEEIENIYRPRKAGNREIVSREAFEKNLTIWPEGAAVPVSLIDSLFDKSAGHRGWQFVENTEFALLQTDLNRDGSNEYVLLARPVDANYITAEIYEQDTEEQWESRYMQVREQITGSLKLAIERDGVAFKEPEWLNLEIGGIVISPE